MKTLNLSNNDEESIIAKYRCKVKEDETRNVNNWNEHFDKLKEKHIQKNRIQMKLITYQNMLEKLQLMETFKFSVITELSPMTQLQSMKTLNLSNVPLTQDEIDILKLELSYTPRQKQNIADFENDIFQFTKKLRLTYYDRNNNIVDKSIVKLESTDTPKPNQNTDVNNICR